MAFADESKTEKDVIQLAFRVVEFYSIAHLLPWQNQKEGITNLQRKARKLTRKNNPFTGQNQTVLEYSCLLSLHEIAHTKTSLLLRWMRDDEVTMPCHLIDLFNEITYHTDKAPDEQAILGLDQFAKILSDE